MTDKILPYQKEKVSNLPIIIGLCIGITIFVSGAYISNITCKPNWSTCDNHFETGPFIGIILPVLGFSIVLLGIHLNKVPKENQVLYIKPNRSPINIPYYCGRPMKWNEPTSQSPIGWWESEYGNNIIHDNKIYENGICVGFHEPDERKVGEE